MTDAERVEGTTIDSAWRRPDGTPAPVPGTAMAQIPLPPDRPMYRLKRRLLGEPLHSDELGEQKLGKPTGLAIMASDNLSSSAYATEEMLHVLIPVVGVAAFSLILPITGALLLMLSLLILSYRQTIKAYPSSGGAYLVTRDAFGLVPAQVAGASLLVGYLLTVAVSVSAGAAALISSFEGLASYRVPIALVFIVIVTYGNLRGIKESGKLFAIPTYFFMVNMALLLAAGLVKYLAGDLPVIGEGGEGTLHFGKDPGGDGLLLGAGAFIIAKTFASGGAAVTGVEAISNGVSSLQGAVVEERPADARVHGHRVGRDVPRDHVAGEQDRGGSLRARHPHRARPDRRGRLRRRHLGQRSSPTHCRPPRCSSSCSPPTQASPGSPRLASFQAGDSFLPRQLTARGHRLVFSNGILALAGTAAVLVVATNAEVTKLIPLYAIGVFIGFTLSQAGMTMRHWRLKERGWRKSFVRQRARLVHLGRRRASSSPRRSSVTAPG